MGNQGLVDKHCSVAIEIDWAQALCSNYAKDPQDKIDSLKAPSARRGESVTTIEEDACTDCRCTLH